MKLREDARNRGVMRASIPRMLSSTRQSTILRRLHAEGEVSVQQLADELAVSASTIRRDLDQMGADGLLRRVRGGGSAVEADPISFAEVDRFATAERDRVARRAADLISDGSVVLLDIGTTTARIARYLRGRRLTVITSSIAVVRELADEDSVEVVVLGGVLRRNYHSLVGALTESALAQVRAQMCFLSASGVRGDGNVMDNTGIEVPVKRAMVAAADRVVLVAGASKFPGTGLLPVCGPDTIHDLVTNVGADQATLDVFTGAGTEVITA
jgi:DeoR/GlpR family transcriptional regulator of sugar metabolism